MYMIPQGVYKIKIYALFFYSIESIKTEIQSISMRVRNDHLFIWFDDNMKSRCYNCCITPYRIHERGINDEHNKG